MAQILLIDSDESIRQQVQQWFEHSGHGLLLADNGHDGVHAALLNPPDLILCALALPNMTGYELLRLLDIQSSTVLPPFIFLLSPNDRTLLPREWELGPRDYLTRPFTRAELLAAVQTRLQQNAVIADVWEQQRHALELNLARSIARALNTPAGSLPQVQQIVARGFAALDTETVKALVTTPAAHADRLHYLLTQLEYTVQIELGLLNPEGMCQMSRAVQMWQLIPSAVELGRRFARHHRTLRVCDRLQAPDALMLVHLPALKHALAEVIAYAFEHAPHNTQIDIHQDCDAGQVRLSVRIHSVQVPLGRRAAVPHGFDQLGQNAAQGLILAQKLLTLHGGTLSMENVDGMIDIRLHVPTAAHAGV